MPTGVLVFVATLGVSCPLVHAQPATDAAHDAGPGRALQNTSPARLAIELAAAGAVALVPRLAFDPASSCGWCATNGFDRAVRGQLLAADPELAGTFSHVGSRALAPAIAIAGVWLPGLAASDVRHALEDTAIIATSFLLTTGLMHGIKKLADRRRPAFQYGVQADTEFADKPDEEFMSFGSADTAWSFAFAAASSTVAWQRGYASRHAVLVLGAMNATAVGLLRIAADAHWASDVLFGAALGTATGLLVPLLLHPRVPLAEPAHTTGSPPRITLNVHVSTGITLIATTPF